MVWSVFHPPCVGDRKADKHTGLVWSDVGADLDLGPRGPWSPISRDGLNIPTFRPMDMDRTFTKTWPGLRSNIVDNFLKRMARSSPPPPMLQSARFMAGYHGRLPDDAVAAEDPFYAIGNLFKFAADAEVQFLNMMEATIKAETADDARYDSFDHALAESNLRRAKIFLGSHIRQLEENLSVIHGPRKIRHWPGADELVPTTNLAATNAADLLERDFRFLVNRARALYEACDRGMDTTRNNALSAEARNAVEKTERTRRLTVPPRRHMWVRLVSAAVGGFMPFAVAASPMKWWAASLVSGCLLMIFFISDNLKVLDDEIQALNKLIPARHGPAARLGCLWVSIYRRLKWRCRPKCQADHIRLEWRCPCGQDYWGDFENSNTDQVRALLAALEEDGYDVEISQIPVVTSTTATGNTATASTGNQGTVNPTSGLSPASLPNAGVAGANIPSQLPSQTPTAANQSASTASSYVIDGRAVYLQLCISTSSTITRFGEVQLADQHGKELIRNDIELFGECIRSAAADTPTYPASTCEINSSYPS